MAKDRGQAKARPRSDLKSKMKEARTKARKAQNIAKAAAAAGKCVPHGMTRYERRHRDMAAWRVAKKAAKSKPQVTLSPWQMALTQFSLLRSV